MQPKMPWEQPCPGLSGQGAAGRLSARGAGLAWENKESPDLAQGMGCRARRALGFPDRSRPGHQRPPWRPALMPKPKCEVQAKALC